MDIFDVDATVANDLLTDLMILVDNDPPVTRDVTKKLNELASVVGNGGPEVRDKTVELGAYAVVCRAWLFCCFNSSSSTAVASNKAVKLCREAVLRALCSLTAGKPEILDDVGWQIIQHTLSLKVLGDQTQIHLYKLIRNICIKSEANREFFTWEMEMLQPLLSSASKKSKLLSNQVIQEYCSALKALILSDDVRVTYNRAPERKRIISKAKILPTLAGHLHQHEYQKDERTMNAMVIFLASMAVNDEMCAEIEAGNALQGIHGIFRHHFNNKTVMRNTVSFLRCLCTNHNVREKSASFALMKWVVDVLSHYKNEQDMVDVVMSCCAHMTLKSACLSAQFLAKNGLHLTLEIMKEYSYDFNILKSSCFTLRNVTENGGSEGKDKVKEVGYPPFLDHLMTTHPELKEFHIKPVLKALGLGLDPEGLTVNELDKATLIAEGLLSISETVLIEPRLGRKSVVLDNHDDD